MATAADGDKQEQMEKEVYEFKDGDDRQRHLYTTASHILYLWELCTQMQLLNKVCQQLSGECAADKQTPRVVSTKRLQRNKDDELFDMSDIDSHMSNLTESVDGLVGVATSSLAQQKEALELGRHKDMWKRRMEGFERKGVLDDAIMELELKAVDETVPTRLKIFEQAMARKRIEVARLTTEIENIDNEVEAMKAARLEAVERVQEAVKRVQETTKKRPLDDFKEVTKKKVFVLEGATSDDNSDDSDGNSSSSLYEEALSRRGSSSAPSLSSVSNVEHKGGSSLDEAPLMCASGSRCIMKSAADSTKHKCPACHRAVHAICGLVDEDACLLYKTTCWPCFDKTGRTLKGEGDVFFGTLAKHV
jgi:hypothetical protein